MFLLEWWFTQRKRTIKTQQEVERLNQEALTFAKSLPICTACGRREETLFLLTTGIQLCKACQRCLNNGVCPYPLCEAATHCFRLEHLKRF